MLNPFEPFVVILCHLNIILTSSQDTILMTCLHLAGLALGLASTFVVPTPSTPSTKPVGTVGALRGCANCWGRSAIHGCLEHPIRCYNQNGSKWIKMDQNGSTWYVYDCVVMLVYHLFACGLIVFSVDFPYESE